MMTPEHHRRSYWVIAIAFGAAAMAMLYVFPPAQYAFYPRCGFYVLTGLQCPGCGGLRAIHCLLHGDVAAAFGYNPLFVALAPGALIAGAWLTFARALSKPLPGWVRRPIWLWLLASVGIAFAVLRNLPKPLAGVL